MISVAMSRYALNSNLGGTMKEKEILTTKDVAEYLDIHPLTVHKYAREGKIPAFKIGTDWRFHKRHLDKWIEDKLAYNAQRRHRI